MTFLINILSNINISQQKQQKRMTERYWKRLFRHSSLNFDVKGKDSFSLFISHKKTQSTDFAFFNTFVLE